MLGSLSRSRIGMRMALGFGRVLPRRAAGRVVAFAANRVGEDSEIMRAARSNQFVISGGTLTGQALEDAARANVRMMGTFLYDLYHVLYDYAAEDAMIVRDAGWDRMIERERDEGPFVYSGIHLGNFDLVGRSLGRTGWTCQLLSVAGPNAGFEWQNEVRREAGFDVTPVTADSLKQAARGLEAGKSILTGHDRPLDAPDKVMPRFFGHAAPMPLLHVRLAMRARVPVVTIGAPKGEDGRYRLLVSDPIPMDGDRPEGDALCANAEKVLRVCESWISEYPAQWAMPHQVWPDVSVPA
ncbi:MAG: hypothetical protein EG823_07140 [Actinobacteria bacterium]|nr:hypothetical protein [Actinomycetota bacterium]